MATSNALRKQPEVPDRSKQILDSAMEHVREARKEKKQREDDLLEAFKFCLPRNLRPNDNGKIENKPEDWAEIYDTTGAQALKDFVPFAKDTFTPEYAHWGVIETDETIPEDEADQIREDIKKVENLIFSEIRKSNFYKEIEPGYANLAISCFGMIIEDPGQGLPMRCQVIPVPEFLMTQGPYRQIDSRFRERNVKFKHLKVNWPEANLPSEIAAKVKTDPEKKIKTIEGCYRVWEQNDETWQTVVILDDKHLVLESVTTGPGSAPIVPCRWDPDPALAMGDGPAIQSIPDMRTIDELAYQLLKCIARAIDPPFAYDDDGIANFEGGLKPGFGYPRAPGSKMEEILSTHRLDIGFFERDEYEMKIKRRFFTDKPHQRGDTPPTAFQWLDESQQTQRRIGSPAGLIWEEFSSPVLVRFQWLLSKRGTLPDVRLGERELTLKPVNPVEKAQRQQEALLADRVLELIQARFGNEAMLAVVDLADTIANIVEMNGVDTVIKLRDKDVINRLVEAVLQQVAPQQAPPQGAPGVPANV